MDETSTVNDRQLSISDVVRNPALGRPFKLGALYDQRIDEIIPGINLWDPEDLRKDVSTTENRNTSYDVTTQESFEDKTNALNIEGNLKLSVLCGLFKADGSAKYLHDRKKSANQARIALKYQCTTRFEELSMKHLAKDNMKYPYVIEQSNATHVVVGILYGAQAFFVFQCDVNNKENHRKIQGEMELVVKKIPKVAIEAGIDVDDVNFDKEKFEKMECKFYGDFLLKSNPNSFKDAVRIYKELPQYLGERNEKVVPLQVWLYPLQALNFKSCTLSREISLSLVKEAENLLDEFQFISQICYDLMHEKVLGNVNHLHERIERFKHLNDRYELLVKEKILSVVPKIRGCSIDEKELTVLLAEKKESPFSLQALKKWLHETEGELKHVTSYLKSLPEVRLLSNEWDVESHIIEHDKVICLKFNLPEVKDIQLLMMEEYLKYGTLKQGTGQEHESFIKAWYTKPDVKKNTRENVKKLKQLKEASSDETKFFVAFTSQADGTQGAQLCFFKDGIEVENEFKPLKDIPVPVVRSKEDIDFHSIGLHWQRLETTNSIKEYRIHFRRMEQSEWLHMDTGSPDVYFKLENLDSDTEYKFKLQGYYEVGMTPESKESEPIRTKRKIKTVAEILKMDSELLLPGNPAIYKLPMKEVLKEEDKKVRRYDILEQKATYVPEKVIMIVGATGSGKSTVLNGVVNYITSVSWSDGFRFKVVTPLDEAAENPGNQAFSQTEYITAYRFHCQHGMPFNYNLTIIDTPGYGDCRGIERDKQITDQVRDFFRHNQGIDHLDAVCFVTPAPGRLTVTQKYIIESIMAIYANDVAENFFLAVTFADNQEPPVIDSMKESGIPYKAFYKFNNSALFAEIREKEGSVDEMTWNMGMNSFKQLFKDLNGFKTKSLQLTNEVLAEREHLENAMECIQPQIDDAVGRMELLKKQKHTLQELEEKILENKDFSYEVEEQVKIKVETEVEKLNCPVCEITCSYCRLNTKSTLHSYLIYSSSLFHAPVMKGCSSCSCSLSKHDFENYQWEVKTVKVIKEFSEQKKKYNIALESKTSQQEILVQMEGEYQKLSVEVIHLVKRVKLCLARLDEIAIRPNHLTTTEYVDILIKNEEQQAKQGWQERKKHLEKVCEQARLLENIDSVEEQIEMKYGKGNDDHTPKQGESDHIPEEGNGDHIPVHHKDEHQQ